MKAFIIKGVFVLTALGLIAASAVVGMSQANAQTTVVPAKGCNEATLRGAMGRLAGAINGFKYTGDVDKDAAHAMVIINTASVKAAQWEIECGSNSEMKAMAQKQSVQQQQSIKAITATMGGA